MNTPHIPLTIAEEAARLTEPQIRGLHQIDRYGDFRGVNGRVVQTLKKRGFWCMVGTPDNSRVELTHFGRQVRFQAMRAHRVDGQLRAKRKPRRPVRRLAHLRSLIAAVRNGQGPAYLEEHAAELEELTR